MNSFQVTLFKQINQRFDTLTKTILEQVAITGKLLEGDPDPSLRTELQHNEQLIDAMEVAIREEIISVIVLHTPRASNLRNIIAVYDTTANLERVGDQILNIDQFTSAPVLSSSLYGICRPDLLKMFNLAADMVKNAIFAIRYADERLAMDVIRTDDQVDGLWHKLHHDLQHIEHTFSVDDRRVMLAVFGLSSNLERIGDQATNIAEAVVYMAEGRDIKHGGLGPCSPPTGGNDPDTVR